MELGCGFKSEEGDSLLDPRGRHGARITPVNNLGHIKGCETSPKLDMCAPSDKSGIKQ